MARHHGVRGFGSGMAAALAALAALAGCEAGAKDPPVMPVLGGKADVSTRVADRGILPFGEADAARAAFGEDLEFHGYTLPVGAGATVTLEVTRTGSSRALDTTLLVYGPRTDAAGYGAAAIAMDDDSGWGRLSRLRGLALAQAGTYLVVVGTHDGRGRGDYRLQATCDGGACVPPAPVAGTCDPAIAAAITACVDDWLADPDHDPSRVTRVDLLEQCADAEVAAPARDALCAGATPPADLCALSMEDLQGRYLPACARELRDGVLDAACVFGERWHDLFDRPAAVVVLSRRTLVADTPRTDLESRQIVEAVHATAYDDVETPEAAFEAVDEGRVNQVQLWDASARRAFTGYEVGAGDNSFGMIFEHGTTRPVVRNNDGDLLDCTATWGDERRPCASDADCRAGLRCLGLPADFPLGRCGAPERDATPSAGASCGADAPCPDGEGLVCSGEAVAGAGTCQPAWMRGRFAGEPALDVPDNRPEGAEAQVLASGLATVATDVVLDLLVSHPRIQDLQVTLVNPAGTEVVVFDRERDGPELVLQDFAVPGFPGDEAANGVWRLRVADRRSGEAGRIERFALTVTSRWD